MWQKVHPLWMRVGIMKSWPCEWFAKDKKSQADFVVEDIRILQYFDKHYVHAGVAKIVIRKTSSEVEIIIFSSKIGVMMWKNGEKIKELEATLKKKFGKEFKVTLKEVKVPEFSAKIMAEFITQQLESRMPYRKVAKTVLKKVMDKGAVGIKIQIGWRLWGADIARTEKFIDGNVSLQTFRSDIDYHYLQANTKYGVLWVKVWISKGNIYQKTTSKKAKATAALLE